MGDGWDQLTIPPGGSDASNRMSFSAKDMAGEEINKATRLKNTSLGIGIGVGYGLGLILIICGAFGFYRLCRQRKAPAVAESDADNSTFDIAPQRVINGGAHG